MLRILSFVLTLFQPISGHAQQAGLNFLSQQFSQTVTPANTFINPSQLALMAGRQSCQIEFAATASSDSATIGYVYFGPTVPTTPSAFQILNRQFINCETNNGEVDGNAVWLSANVGNSVFIIKVK